MTIEKLILIIMLPIVLMGCAATGDRDRDGIADKYDECPNEQEDWDGFEDLDGCPDLDNDKDGIPDSRDQCINAPEDFDGFEDEDGCPDPDNDGDGILDIHDKCPNEPEDFDGFEDEDGCPDPDNDGDGILDIHDKCPNEPEDFNGFEDEDGCPDQHLMPSGAKAPSSVPPVPVNTIVDLQFEGASSVLTVEDKELLEKLLVKGLLAWPDHKIYIYVFLSLGDLDIKSYLNLLNERTRAIADFLHSRGVARIQIKTRTITVELFEANIGTENDFNQKKPVIFNRK
jgi:hypothetical protein